jgi:hypothetical protein
MATNNRVFVSPGVYTSEVDLTFVAQSVGVTTLGLVGETLKGPAFEPILITNFDEFKTYFGTTSSEKDGNDNPKFELPYVAKSYLQESNQLFVTRILGLTGYKANITYGIKTASSNAAYNGIVVGLLRSRGHYNQQTLVHEVTSLTGVTMSGTGVTVNPLADFTLTVKNDDADTFTFSCNFDKASAKYITKVLGTNNFDKDKASVPLYVHEAYPNLIQNLFAQRLISGLTLSVSTNYEDDNFMKEWDTPMSPTVVSEVRGGKVDDLFDIITISDGEAANKLIKVTFMNINADTGEFDMVVRDFNDTDDNMVVLEKYSRCSMNPDVSGYVAKKVGTSDGEYFLNSKYIMLNMATNAPSNAYPAGFKGFTLNNDFSGKTAGGVVYKTKYFDAGDVMYSGATGSPVYSNGDKVKKVSLGLSTQTNFNYDADLFDFKGKSSAGATKGFHLSVNAATITGSTGNVLYETTQYDLEGLTEVSDGQNKLKNINYRKFTLAVAGGYDGWDVYRNVRTYGDAYIYGKSTYVSGTTGGVFSDTVGNSDYYAYLKGIETYANPEAVDINVFATPGIDWYNHNSLSSQAIDVIENERADSIYIMNAPGPTDFSGPTAADDIADNLDTLGYDSNYSATFWPWIQVRDVDNATQIYIPPTGEVVRNIALTDNVSYPWFAVAGYNRGIVNSIKAAKKLTLDERDSLYKNRVNPIATFSDTGTIIWGNKTLQVRESALDRINVRRLLLRARKLISAVAVRLLFEQNDDQVRQEFLRLVNPILEAIKKERGLYDFRVSVSNSPEDIDANTLRGKIYVKPTRSLEFIDLEFVITPTGASFENI